MNGRLTIMFLTCLLLFSCKKEEQSCSDGIFTPGKEEKLDCGGVCPPCDFVPTPVDTYLSTKINDVPTSFSTFSLEKSPDWILSFENDTLNIKLNFGQGDSLDGRPIQSIGSNAIFNTVNYSYINEGFTVFSEVNHTENYLSGYFNAKFVSDNDIYDTLKITNGEFQKINW
ncbi:MAG TPA: hypothetical protein VKY37_07715 [Brumimicrobium sp.]|nr:hypothetical protein [Brumimicrobium sp.]